MIAATRRWFRRNRTPIAIGVGVVGAGYVATQYVLNKINNARERMSSDRIAKENLRRRFEQNQEDCTFTVLALLPTATANILDAMNTEKITLEIQQMKAPRSTTTTNNTTTTTTSNGGGAPVESSSSSAPVPAAQATTTTGPPPSIADTTITEEEGGKSIASIQSESGVHASQVAVPPPAATATDPGEGTSQQESAQAAQQQARRTKRQLWDDLTISSLTRCFTLIYTLALLAMLTRIQLNLLGRRSYLSSVVSLATGSPQSTINLENHDDGGNDYGNDADKADDEAASYYGSDFETNRKYLTFSWWLLNRGWTDVMERVERAVRDVFGHLSPRDLLSLDTFSQLVLEVRKKVEGGDPALLSDPAAAAKSRSSSTSTSTSWLSFLLPPSTLEDFVLRESGVLGDSAAAMTGSQAGDATASVAGSTATTTPRSPTPASLRRLLDETSDLIESPAFTHVLTQLLDAGFSFLIHRKLLPGAFEASSSSTGSTPAPTTTAASVTSISEVAAATAASLSDPPAYGGDAKAVVMLPKILSVLTRQAHAVGAGMPNEYLREMELVPDLEAFAAVVYSSNWENEIRQDGAETSSSSFASLSLGGGGGLDQQSLRGSTLVDESLVIVDSPLHSREQQQQQQQREVHTPTTNSFDAAWEKATGGR